MHRRYTVALVTHSLGELDILFPMFAAVGDEKKANVILVFTVFRLWRSYQKSRFFKACARELEVDVRFLWLPNRFDVPKTRVSALIYRYVAIVPAAIIGTVSKYKISKLVDRAEKVLHETTIRSDTFRLIYSRSREKKTKVLAYHHGHSLNQIPKMPKKRPVNPVATLLIFDKKNSEWGKDLGYVNQEVIGFPKLHRNWRSMIENFIEESHRSRRKQHVVIYTRGWEDHSVYMERALFRELISEVYHVLTAESQPTEVVIKPHPRQKISNVKKILDDLKIMNVTVSDEHPGVLAMGAQFAVSMWTSCIFDSLMAGVPTVEYFREPKQFREAEPRGSLYPLVGLPVATGPEELIAVIDRQKMDKNPIPPIVSHWTETVEATDFGKLFELNSARVGSSL